MTVQNNQKMWAATDYSQHPVYLLNREAKEGNPYAIFELAKKYQLSNDNDKCEKYLNQAVEILDEQYSDEEGSYDPKLLSQIDLEFGVIAQARGRAQNAFTYFKRAYSSNPENGLKLAECYEKGYGCEKHPELYAEIVRKAALKSNVYEQLTTGLKLIEKNHVIDGSELLQSVIETQENDPNHAYYEAAAKCILGKYNQTDNEGNVIDLETETRVLEKLSEKENDGLGYYILGHIISNDENIEYLKKAGEQLNNEEYQLSVCLYLADHFYKSDSDQEKAEAFHWYQKAAEFNNPLGQRGVGLCYYNGYGVAQNQEEAVKWYQTAADQGNDEAQRNLGYCYKTGNGIAQDYNEAFKWYQKAADQGNAKAQNQLGIFYENGTGTTKDKNEAVKWYQNAAKQGNAYAQFNLGNCYYDAIGVYRDYDKAADLFQQAAAQGNLGAQNMLGYCYYQGCGVERDVLKAVEWFQKAAEKGNAAAQFHLGQCYFYGNGVKQNYREAELWYKKAEAQNYQGAAYSVKLCKKEETKYLRIIIRIIVAILFLPVIRYLLGQLLYYHDVVVLFSAICTIISFWNYKHTAEIYKKYGSSSISMGI